MNRDCMLSYLADLEFNNEREWFHANKPAYREALREFEALVESLILEMAKIEPAMLNYRPKDLTFRLMRDTRFRKDKSPYNPSFRAHLSPAGKRAVPVGLYLKIQPGGRSIIGGGLFTDMFRDATLMVREYIADHGDEWEAILHAPSFTKWFSLQGTALKNIPRGYDAAHPQADYLKQKSWYVACPVSDQRVTEMDFAALAMDVYAAMRPFNDYLNRALSGFVIPEYY